MTVWKCSWNQTNREPACLSCVDKRFRTERNKLWFGAFNISMPFFFCRNTLLSTLAWQLCVFSQLKNWAANDTSVHFPVVTQRNAHIVAVRDSMTHQYSNHDSPDL